MASVVIVETSSPWFDAGLLAVGLLTFLAIGAGVWVAWKQLGRQAKIAESEHLMGMLRRWSEMPLQEARHLVDSFEDGDEVLLAMDEYEDSHDEREFVLLRIPAFFEDLGILALDLKVVEVRSVKNSVGSSIDYYWKRFKPLVLDMRKKREERKAVGKVPTAYKWFEDLKNEVS